MSSFIFGHPLTATRSCNLGIYSLSALGAAETAFRDFCQVRRISCADNQVSVTLSIGASQDRPFRTIVLEFWDYFLAKSVQERLTLLHTL